MKTFDELFAELHDRATRRPAGSTTVAALDAGVHAQGKKYSTRQARSGSPRNTRPTSDSPRCPSLGGPADARPWCRRATPQQTRHRSFSDRTQDRRCPEG